MRGLFIAIEGGDGSGKGTQTELLRKHFVEKLDKRVLKLSFPRYGEDSAYYIERYLNGDYGSADNVPGDLASLAFAIDRFAASSKIRAHLEDLENIVISDRYVASNLAHQGTKFIEAEERHKFYERNMITEYEVLGIPKPDKNIILLVQTSIAQENVDKKDTRLYTDKKRDIHEASTSHLDRAKSNYEELCRLYSNEFTSVECIDMEGNMRTVESIHQEILSIIDSLIIVKLANPNAL